MRRDQAAECFDHNKKPTLLIPIRNLLPISKATILPLEMAANTSPHRKVPPRAML